MKGDVISNHFLMPWLQKDSLDTVGFRTYGGGVQSPKPKSDILSLKCAKIMEYLGIVEFELDLDFVNVR